VLSAPDKVVPIVTNSAHVAELALDGGSAHERIPRHNAGLPSESALRAIEIGFIDVGVAVFARTHRQVLAHVAIHVDLEDPVADLVSFRFAHYILFRQDDVVGGRNVSALEFFVVGDWVGIGVFDCVVKIDVSVEENEGGIVVLDLSIRFSSIDKGFIGADQLRIAQ